MGTNGKRKVAADIANLRQPISTTITGMKQAINVLNSGTLEAKQVLLNEANIIYECKVCFSMFRSIANLVAHKRTFCRLESKTALHVYAEEDPNDQDDQLVCVEQEEADGYDDPSTWNLDNYSPSMELIKTAGILEDLLASKYRPEELNPNKSILAVNKKLKAMAEEAEKHSYSSLKSEVRSEKRFVSNNPGQIILEPVYNTTNAFFQSWKVSECEPTQKDLYSDWNSFKDNNNHVIVKNDNSTVDNSNQQSSKQTTALEKRFPCSFCDQDYHSIWSLKRHYLKLHEEKHGSFNMHRQKFLKASFFKDISSEISPKDESSLMTPIKPLMINMSKRLVTQAHLDDLNDQKLVSLDKSEDTVPKQVEEKIMEYVNRRHVQCKECLKRFRTTKLVQQHVANEHLKFRRFLCCFCDFGSWSREHVIKHAAASHRKSSKDVVEEQDVKDYFVMPVATPPSSKKKLLLKSPGSTTPLKRLAEARLSPVKLLHDNLINLDKKEKSPSNCSEQDSDNELLPSSVLTGLKDQIRKSIEDDHKPLLPINGDTPVPVKTPSTRPKRKRETSGCSCASSTQDEVSLKGLKSSPTLILDTRAPSTRLKSPTKTKSEFCVKSKQKNCTKVKSKCAPAQPAKSGDSKKVKRSISK